MRGGNAMRREMEDIKCRLCDELAEFADKRQWTDRDVETIDRLTHSIKSLMKYLEMEENGETYGYEDRSYARGRYDSRSYRDGRRSYDGGNSYNRYYDDRAYDDMSYRGGRSRDDGHDMQEMADELQDRLNNATDADVKDAIKKTIAHIKKNK